LISIDMAGISKLKAIEVTDNVSLTTIVAPVTTGTDIFAEAGASITVTVTGNDLAATYTEGVTGTIVTQTVPSQDAEAATLAVPAGIESLLDWYDAAAAITTTASFETVSYVDRVRSTVDGSITDTASTTTFASFHAATLLDSYSSDPAIGLSDGTGFHGVNSDKELAIVVRD
jgi:hypothetical protein